MKIWRSAALVAAALAAAAARAEPLVFVSGATLRSGEIAEILELPNGSMLRATDLIAEFWRSAQDPGATLGYDVATQRFRDDLEPYLGAAGLDRLRESHDWFSYDAAIRGFVPLGQGPVVPAAAMGSPGELLEQPGAVLVAAARAPAAPDRDADGVPDAFDDCIFVPDGPAAPGPFALVQRDTNGDGYGNACDPDLNGDGIVNFIDLARMKNVFFRRNPDADLNGVGLVSFADLARLKAFFFKPPGPSGQVR
jgi:hypothetical protein